MSSESLAILLRLAAAAFAVALGACVHGAAKYAPVGQIVFFRGIVAVVPILIYAGMTGPLSALRPRTPRLHLTRGVSGGIAMTLSFTALSFLPVAHASALGYLAPILTLPVAVVLLGERVTPRLLVAVGMGFAGVVAMLYTSLVRPDWGWPQVIGIGAALAGAVLMAFIRVYIKSMTRTETVTSMALSFALITSCLGLGSVLWGNWVPLHPALLGWLVGAGVMGGLTHIAATEAAARAAVSTLAPFDYSGLVWAVMFDILIFSTYPTGTGYLGMVLITGAGLVVAFSPRPPAPPTAGLRGP